MNTATFEKEYQDGVNVRLILQDENGKVIGDSDSTQLWNALDAEYGRFGWKVEIAKRTIAANQEDKDELLREFDLNYIGAETPQEWERDRADWVKSQDNRITDTINELQVVLRIYTAQVDTFKRQGSLKGSELEKAQQEIADLTEYLEQVNNGN